LHAQLSSDSRRRPSLCTRCWNVPGTSRSSTPRTCSGVFAYACAYTARCGHALGVDEREVPGTFQHLVHSEGRRLLSLLS
jgi:hypothetical protein